MNIEKVESLTKFLMKHKLSRVHVNIDVWEEYQKEMDSVLFVPNETIGRDEFLTVGNSYPFNGIIYKWDDIDNLDSALSGFRDACDKMKVGNISMVNNSDGNISELTIVIGDLNKDDIRDVEFRKSVRQDGVYKKAV